MTTPRDDELGAALRALEVPEHGPTFWSDLGERLAAERATGSADGSPATAGPRDLPTSTGGAAGPGGTVHLLDGARNDRRTPGRRTRSGGGTRSAPLAGRGRWVASGAVAALVAVVAAAVALLPDDPAQTVTIPSADTTSSTEPEPDQPAPTAVAAGLTADVEVTLDDGSVRRLEVVAARDGSRSVTDLDTGQREVRDAAEGVLVQIPPRDATGVGATAYRTTGIPAGGPFALLADAASAPDLVDHVLALADAGDPSVTPTEVLGRPALRLQTALAPNKLAGPGAPDQAVVVVDRETALLLLLEETAGGQLARRIEVTAITTTDEAPDPSTFRPDGDAEAFEEPYVATSLEEVGDLVGDAGLVPTAVPDGYELSSVWAAPGDSGPSGPEGSNPPTIDAVVVTYRDGWRQLVVTSRRTGGDRRAWDDPFRGEGQVLETAEAVVDGGGVDGTTVTVVVDPTTTPHLWGVHPEVVVTVSGPLAPERLLEVAGSLRRTG